MAGQVLRLHKSMRLWMIRQTNKMFNVLTHSTSYSEGLPRLEIIPVSSTTIAYSL